MNEESTCSYPSSCQLCRSVLIGHPYRMWIATVLSSHLNPDHPPCMMCHLHLHTCTRRQSPSAAETPSNSFVSPLLVYGSCWTTTTDMTPHRDYNVCFGQIYSLTCSHWLILLCYSLSPHPLIVVCSQPREMSLWFSNPRYIYCRYRPQGYLLMLNNILSSHKSTFGATSTSQIIPHVGWLNRLITALAFMVGIYDNRTNSDI